MARCGNAVRQFIAGGKYEGFGFDLDAVCGYHLHSLRQRHHLGELTRREQPAAVGDGMAEQADSQRCRVDVGGAVRQQGRVAIQTGVGFQLRVREKA